MFKQLTLITIIIATLLSCGPAGSDIVAKVNNDIITKAEFTQALKYKASKFDPKTLKDNARMSSIKQEVLDDLIRERVLYTEAIASGINISEKDLEEEIVKFKSSYSELTFQKMLQIKGINPAQWKEEKRRELIADRFVQKGVVDSIKVSDAEIQKYYKQHKKEFTHGDEVHARQIVLDDPRKAEEIYKKLQAGENFAALAQEHSIAPEAKHGGDLGWFARGVMPKIFDEACFPLPNGEISPIVKTEYGYHIFKVLERRNTETLPLEDVKDQIVVRIQ